jgi:predicted nucleotidyltransferase
MIIPNSNRLSILADICQQSGVETIYAFGSRAMELLAWLRDEIAQLTPGPSDVDIGIKPRRNGWFSLDEKVRLAQALEDFFGVTRVDIVSLQDADPFLAVNIIRGERLYAKDSYPADEYELYVLRRAGDNIPLERERLALIHEGANHAAL